MQKKNETIHLLILDPSQNDAERLISLLRNAGRATRAHRMSSQEDLLETLNPPAGISSWLATWMIRTPHRKWRSRKSAGSTRTSLSF